MRKDVTLLEAMKLTGKDAYELIGVNRETKHLIRRSVNTVVGSNALVQAIEEVNETIQEVVIQEVIIEEVEDTSLIKPSHKFDIDDYIRYQEYVLRNGGKPSVKDYFKAVDYYLSRA